MTKNLGSADRTLRVVGAIGAGLGAAFAPLPLVVRLGVLGATAVYLMLSALVGSCLGYRLMGKSTCATGQRA